MYIGLYKTPNKALSCLLFSWKKRRGGWGVKEGNACNNNPVLFTSALAIANFDWLISQQNKLVKYTKLAISVSLCRVVKHFPNDDFSVRFQNQCQCLQLSAWLSRNIFYTTIIQQNIGFLSSECKCYLLRRLCIKCFNNSNSRFCVRRVTHCRAFCEQGLSRINFSRSFFFQLFTVRFETFLSYITCLWRDSGGKLCFASIFHSLSILHDKTVQLSCVSNFASTRSADLF